MAVSCCLCALIVLNAVGLVTVVDLLTGTTPAICR